MNINTKKVQDYGEDAFPILNSRYKILKKIGAGSFGKVFMAEDLTTHNKVAIKQVNKCLLEGNDYLYQAFWKELEIMKLCECENSVYLYDHFECDGNYNIIMELCDTDLEVVLNSRPSGFNEEELKIILTQLNTVFEKMYKENIIHRDLKLKNILVKYDKNVPLIGFAPKLSDFGFSKVMDEDITRTKLGTPATMAPEILMGKPYNKKADLWSIGVISFQLLYRTLPFSARSERELLNTILKSDGVHLPNGTKNTISNTLFNLLKMLLKKNPNERIEFVDYFNHPFFIGDKKQKITEEKVALDTKLKYEDRFESMRKLSDDYSDYAIYRAKDKTTGKFVYLKQIAKKVIDGNLINKAIFNKEIELMKKLKGDCFVEYIDSYETTTHYIIVIEYFEGKTLDNFIKSRKSISEQFVQKIIKNISPALKEIYDKGIILEFLSTKSFCFSYFISEDNFNLKFFDYGLSIVFTSELNQAEFLFNEAKMGTILSQKTNVLSFGIIVYELLFGEPIYTFKLNESFEETISKRKIILFYHI